MNALANAFSALHGWIFEQLIQPALFALGLMNYAEIGFDAVEALLVGLIEIALMLLILAPLERLRPVETWRDRRAIRVDVLYTCLRRLGLLPLIYFFLLLPVQEAIEGWLRWHGIIPKNLEDLVPALRGHALLTFLAYVVILDLADYWRHRLQHRFQWWWALHSLHHSQRQLTFWADDRNHLLDDLIADLWFAAIALAIGVAPTQFILIVAARRLWESLAHANLRLSFPAAAERVLVGPRFHRLHHAIGAGHEGGARGVNFATLLPLWDVLFGTASFAQGYLATGIRDQLSGRDYGTGFWRQQVLGLKRLAASVSGRENSAR